MYKPYLEKFISFVVFIIQTLPIIENIFVCLLVINIIDKRISIWSPTNDKYKDPNSFPITKVVKHRNKLQRGQKISHAFSLIIPKWGRK